MICTICHTKNCIQSLSYILSTLQFPSLFFHFPPSQQFMNIHIVITFSAPRPVIGIEGLIINQNYFHLQSFLYASSNHQEMRTLQNTLIITAVDGVCNKRKHTHILLHIFIQILQSWGGKSFWTKTLPNVRTGS